MPELPPACLLAYSGKEGGMCARKRAGVCGGRGGMRFWGRGVPKIPLSEEEIKPIRWGAQWPTTCLE